MGGGGGIHSVSRRIHDEKKSYRFNVLDKLHDGRDSLSKSYNTTVYERCNLEENLLLGIYNRQTEISCTLKRHRH